MNLNAEYDRLLREAGLGRLSPVRAKLEILIGLAAAAVGILCGVRGVLELAAEAWWLIAAGVLLQTLGGYLALAGHRSHRYQSQNKLAAYLAAQVRHGAD